MNTKVTVKIKDHGKKITKITKVFDKALTDSQVLIDTMTMESQKITDSIAKLENEKLGVDLQIKTSTKFIKNLKTLMGCDEDDKIDIIPEEKEEVVEKI